MWNDTGGPWTFQPCMTYGWAKARHGYVPGWLPWACRYGTTQNNQRNIGTCRAKARHRYMPGWLPRTCWHDTARHSTINGTWIPAGSTSPGLSAWHDTVQHNQRAWGCAVPGKDIGLQHDMAWPNPLEGPRVYWVRIMQFGSLGKSIGMNT